MSASRSLLRPYLRSKWICEECVNKSHQNTFFQRRWISRNHINKILTAEEEWQFRKAEIESGKKKSMLDLLEERGYINQIVGTRDDLNKLLNEKRVGIYAGVDPTAPSLHVGHMVPFMALGWMFLHGYPTTTLMGGFTASIGDPIGRLTGREAQDKKSRAANSVAMFQQLKRLGIRMENYAKSKGYLREWAWRRALMNNYQWWQKLTYNDFMKVLGTGTRIGPMLGRDTVKNRLEAGEGMSFAEFSYPLCQAWDWWELYKTGTRIQIGGADQFGNILAGAEAVKHLVKTDPEYVAEQTRTALGHVSPNDSHPIPGDVREKLYNSQINAPDYPMGFTVPLLTTASGEKFGKSAGNAVWLEPSMTSSFDLYQFFLRSADADVERYLKLFTFLPGHEIATIMEEQHKDESKRVAQHKLASEFVQLVHGESEAREAERQHRGMFEKKLTLNDIQAQAKASTNEITSNKQPAEINPLLNKYAKPLHMDTAGDVNIILPKSLVIQQPLSRILWSAGLVASRTEGQRMINAKGVYLGGQASKDGTKPMGETLSYARIDDPKWSTVSEFLIDENVLIMRTGKWRVKVVTIVSDEEYEKSGQSCPGWNEHKDDKELEKMLGDLQNSSSSSSSTSSPAVSKPSTSVTPTSQSGMDMLNEISARQDAADRRRAEADRAAKREARLIRNDVVRSKNQDFSRRR